MEGIQIVVENAGARNEVAVVKITGYIDTTTASELERAIQNLLREQRYKIIVDLQAVDYISSAGWGIFISEIKNIRSHQGDLKLTCMSESVAEVYELLEFSTILNSTNSVANALKLFGVEETKAPVASAKLASAKAEAAPVSVSARLPRSAPEAAPPAPVRLEGPAGLSAVPSAAATPKAPERLTLIDRVRAVVKMHPEWGAWKIKKELNRTRGVQAKVSWGEVRMELKYHGLKSVADRFRYAQNT